MSKTYASILLFLFSSTLCGGQVQFIDVTEETGISITGSNYGIAVGDFDNDGWEDLLFSMYRSRNYLYKNNGDRTFSEVGMEVGLTEEENTLTSIFVDFDNDGDLDIYAGNSDGPDHFYINDAGTFKESSWDLNIVNSLGQVRSVNAADVNNDGFIDIYISRPNLENILWINEAGKSFTNLVYLYGLTSTEVAQGSIFCDIDQDGDQDLFLVHDDKKKNILYRNNGDESFTEVGAEMGFDFAGFGMGIDVGDINQDGWMDIYLTNLYENKLYINNNGTTLSEVSYEMKVDDLGMAWSTSLEDVDNDGDKDIYISNDTYFQGPSRPNVLYINNQDSFSIIDTNTVLTAPYASYGHVFSDIDQDGDLDIIVANIKEDKSQVLLNTSQNLKSARIKLIGSQSNYEAIGARVVIHSGGSILADQVTAGQGYASQSSPMLHFGIPAEYVKIDSLTVFWPSGSISTLRDVFPSTSPIIIEEGETTSISAHAHNEISWKRLNSKTFLIEDDQEEYDRFELYSLDGRKFYEGKIQNHIITWDTSLPSLSYTILIRGKYKQSAIRIILP